MKRIFFILMILSFTLHAYSQGGKRQIPRYRYQVYQVDPKSDISSIQAPKNLLKDIKAEKVISREERDMLMEKYLSKDDLQKMDELERDLFIKRLIHYKGEDFLKKYSGILSKEMYRKFSHDVEQFR